MGCTVSELLNRISSQELSEWQAFELVCGPIGQARDDALTGFLAHRFTAIFASKKGGKPIPIEPYMPKWVQPTSTSSTERSP